MALIVDGHNLIGILPDINLGDPEDELSLLNRLRTYRARAGGQPLIVFFDSGDLPSALPDLSSPGLLVRFATPGQTADDAILEFLKTRAQPGQYAVVTNDLELADQARLAGASILAASEFAPRLVRRRRRPSPSPPVPDPRDPSYADIYAAFLDSEKRQARLAEMPGQDPAPWLERLYGDDVEQAGQAAHWFGLHGGEQALEALRDALTHSDARVRAAAALALGDLGDPQALPDLMARLQHDAATLAREAAAQTLGRVGDRSVQAALIESARTDPKRKVRKAAEAALAQIRARHPRG